MANKKDDTIINNVVKAISTIANATKHQKMARELMELLASDMVVLVAYYDRLREYDRPKYLEHVVSGKMSKRFKKVFQNDRNSSLDILAFTQHEATLHMLQRAIATCEGNEELKDEEVEHAALGIMREILLECTSKSAVQKRAIHRAQNLYTCSDNVEIIETDVDRILTTTYLR